MAHQWSDKDITPELIEALYPPRPQTESCRKPSDDVPEDAGKCFAGLPPIPAVGGERLADFAWTGLGDGQDFNDPLNWAGAKVPMPNGGEILVSELHWPHVAKLINKHFEPAGCAWIAVTTAHDAKLYFKRIKLVNSEARDLSMPPGYFGPSRAITFTNRWEDNRKAQARALATFALECFGAFYAQPARMNDVIPTAEIESVIAVALQQAGLPNVFGPLPLTPPAAPEGIPAIALRDPANPAWDVVHQTAGNVKAGKEGEVVCSMVRTAISKLSPGQDDVLVMKTQEPPSADARAVLAASLILPCPIVWLHGDMTLSSLNDEQLAEIGLTRAADKPAFADDPSPLVKTVWGQMPLPPAR